MAIIITEKRGVKQSKLKILCGALTTQNKMKPAQPTSIAKDIDKNSFQCIMLEYYVNDEGWL